MKIVHLETAALEQVELKAVEDLSFMKVIDGDDAQYGGLSSFISADNSFRVGSSAYTKVSLTLTNWPTNEFMYFLEGQVEITDEETEMRLMHSNKDKKSQNHHNAKSLM